MAKKIITRIFAALVLFTFFSGCRELPLIGDLAGQWQIVSIVYPDGNVVNNPERYYAFYRHTAQLTAPGGNKHTANMTYDNPELALEFPKVSPIWLSEWGVSVPEGSDDATRGWVQRYHIDKLDNSHLVMTTAEGAVITLRKY